MPRVQQDDSDSDDDTPVKRRQPAAARPASKPSAADSDSDSSSDEDEQPTMKAARAEHAKQAAEHHGAAHNPMMVQVQAEERNSHSPASQPQPPGFDSDSDSDDGGGGGPQRPRQGSFHALPHPPAPMLAAPPPNDVAAAMAALAAAGELDDDAVQELFELADEDDSGTLDKEEVAKLAAACGMAGLSAEALDAAFAQMDYDGNGDVDSLEFTEWWRSVEGSPVWELNEAAELDAARKRAAVSSPCPRRSVFRSRMALLLLVPCPFRSPSLTPLAIAATLNVLTRRRCPSHRGRRGASRWRSA